MDGAIRARAAATGKRRGRRPSLLERVWFKPRKQPWPVLLQQVPEFVSHQGPLSNDKIDANPVHSGPDVSSAILGYVAAGTDMQLLRRELGWVKVLDPATARQGWIYEQHIIAKAGPDAIQEVAAADEAGLGPLDEPTQSFKFQKSRKNYVSKKRRHYGENRRRKVIGFFRFRRF